MKCNEHDIWLEEEPGNPTALYCPMCTAEADSVRVDSVVRFPVSSEADHKKVCLWDKATVDLSGDGKPPSIYCGEVTMISRRGIDVAIYAHGTFFVKWRNVKEIERET